jgi:hypothetical protein
LAAGAVHRAFAQEKEKRRSDAGIPLVYKVENTGARYAAPVFPDFGHLPIVRPLPDAFRSVDGSRDSSFPKWEQRRNEIKAAIERYEIGPKPDCLDCTITAKYMPPAAGAEATARGKLTVVVTRKGRSLTLTSGVSLPLPTAGAGPYPVLIAMTFMEAAGGPNYGRLPASVFSGLPVATVDFVHNQTAAYSRTNPSDHRSDPFYQLYPELCAGVCTGPSNSGEYAAWSWGVSRLIDGMILASKQKENPLPIDTGRLAVTGCSYAGKMALFAGAFDERIALTIAQENGGGGAASWRVSRTIEPQGSVENIDDTNYDWFSGEMKQFAGDNVYKLPTDHDELMAMVAPRALLETGNSDYYWLSNRSNYVSARATQRIYKTFGIGDRFGFYIDGGHAHCGTLPVEAPALASFVNRFLLGHASEKTDVEVHPFPDLDYSRWTAWWGGNRKEDPTFPNTWNTGASIVMPMEKGLKAMPIHPGDVVKGGYQVQIPGVHPEATVTFGSGSVQADVGCPDGTSYVLTVPMTAGQSYSIPASNEPDLIWTPPNSDAYQGSSAASGCSSGVSPGVVQGVYFSAWGRATKVGSPPAGTGFTTSDTADPLMVRFDWTVNDRPSVSSEPITVNFK